MTKTEIQNSANAAADWVVRLQGGSADEGDWLAFDGWLTASEGNGPAYDRALALWLELDAVAPALRHCIPRPALVSWRISATVGALAAGLALGWVLISNNSAPVAGELYETVIGEHKTITLADGSRLDLDGATRLSVRLEKNARRVTMDHGEAIYEVAPDSSRPFIILAGDRQVRVVGTEFDVRQRDGAFSLTVKHGVVEVSSVGVVDGAVVRLVQGDRLDHSAGQPDRRSSGVSADEIFGWRSGQLVYRERPLSEVVSDLNAHYVRQISLDSKAAAQPFSGVLALDSEEDVVHRLTLLTSLWSTSNDTGYVLHAKDGARR
jgi:transmembrane sensor